MTVRVLPVDVLAAKAGVDLHVVVATGTAAVRDVRRLNAAEDRVEVVVADMETEVVTLELLAIGKIEGQCLVEIDGREVTLRFRPGYVEEVRQELRPRESVVGRNDHVVEPDDHGAPPGAMYGLLELET